MTMPKPVELMKGILTVIPVAIGLGGCTVGPDYRRPDAAISATWISAVDAGDVDVRWWKRFEDPLLTELVTLAIAGNKDLAEAGARLREARANRDAVAARSSPQAGLSAVATQNRLSENGLLPVGKMPDLGRELSIFDVGFDASWELDLWGGTRRARESAEARAQSMEEARRAVVMQVITEVVRSYIDLRTAQSLEANAFVEAEAQQGLARLVADRERVGLASRFDLMRAQALAQSAAAAVPGFDGDTAAAVFRLALLLGKPPEGLYDTLRKPAFLPTVKADVMVGLRSDLLRRRPDIRQAERDLAAATAEVGVATADLFPRISLIGNIGVQARDPGDLSTDKSLRFQFGPSLRWPIFSGGRIRSQIRASDARVDAAAIRYERAVLTALSDSETAINRYASLGLSRAERDAARASARGAADLALRRYRAGEDDLTAVLLSQSSFITADRLSIQTNAAMLQQLAALYKALGGGWEAMSEVDTN